MATCAGCGEPLAPAWKFCIHCGVAVDSQGDSHGAAHAGARTAAPGSTAGKRPGDVKHARRLSANGRAYVIGGIGIFVIGVALLVIAVAFLTGAIH